MPALPEDSLDVVAVWIQNERREVAKGIVAGAEPRATIILAARRKRSAVKVDLAAAARSRGGLLLRSMLVKHIDPENRVAHAIADSAKLRIVAAAGYSEGFGDARYPLNPYNCPKLDRSMRRATNPLSTTDCRNG